MKHLVTDSHWTGGQIFYPDSNGHGFYSAAGDASAVVPISELNKMQDRCKQLYKFKGKRYKGCIDAAQNTYNIMLKEGAKSKADSEFNATVASLSAPESDGGGNYTGYIIAIVAVLIIGGGGYYFFSRKSTPAVATQAPVK